GFGATNLSGAARSIGSVGDQEISIDEYARGLQEEIRAIEAQTRQPLSFADAQAFGLDRNVLARLVTAAALDNEAARLGVSVGDAVVAEQILEIPAFQSINGDFDRDAYRFALQQAGLNESRFEDQLRRETARGLLQGAMVQSAVMPQTYVDTLIAYAGERRGFSWATLDASQLEAPVGAPTEAQLTAWYEANPEVFTTPAAKRITMAALTPDMILNQVTVDEEALRAEYDARSAEFNTPERRLVERLVFANDAAAEAGLAALTAGETDFETLVEERGLTLADVDLGDVSLSALGTAGEAVFAAEVGTVVGPFPTSLGPALFRVNGVLDAQNIPFEQVRDDLAAELAPDRARRVIQAQSSGIDDMLAGGATLEELAADTDMEMRTIDWSPDVDAGIAAYPAFRSAAAELTADDYPTLIELDDGGIFAMRLDEELPPRLVALEDMREVAIAAWQAEETAALLRTRAEAIVASYATTGDLAAEGLTVTEERNITRDQFIPGTAPGFLSRVFQMEPDDLAVIDGPVENAGPTVLIVRLDEVLPADETDTGVIALRARLSDSGRAGLAQDLFQSYVGQLQMQAGVQLDQAAINAVHTNLQ
ncbi:MAG: peptidyl-prolyl cis-trans isomerase, partial [Rhodobacterales bacterium]|nr:peptidyl-prolyl cis-trans isomerase [Rhodobacterales bacterium]